MSKITKVIARQVFDSRGNPTVEAEVYSKNLSASSICPSGASTGTYEAYEKRDKSNKKYLGKSVFKAIEKINGEISKALIGINSNDQETLDVDMFKVTKLPDLAFEHDSKIIKDWEYGLKLRFS